MAVIEIKAATLPGFPYYFPYRTGVRLQATIDALGGKTFTGSASAAITAEATVTSQRTATILADLAAAIATDSEDKADYITTADTATTAETTAETERDAAVSADTGPVTAMADAVIGKGQLLESSLSLEVTSDAAGTTTAPLTADRVITASPSATARLDAVGYVDLTLNGSTVAIKTLDAVAEAHGTVLASSDQNFVQDHLFSASADIVAIATGESGLGTTILALALEIFTAQQESLLSRVLFGSTELDITASTQIDFNNISTRLDLAAEFAAEGHRTQYPEATLGVSAEALVDCFGTRYGSAELGAVATPSVIMSNGRVLAAEQTEITASQTAEVVLTQYVAASLSVTVSSDTLASQNQQLVGSLAVSTARSTAGMRTHNAIATRTVTANLSSVALRKTFATAEMAIAVTQSAASRSQLLASAALTNLVALPTILTLQALIEAENINAAADLASLGTGEFFTEVVPLDFIATIFADPVVEFPFAANLRATADLELNGGLLLATETELNIQAELAAQIENFKYIESPDLEIVTTFDVPGVQFILSANAELEVQASTSAVGLWRHSGGNPMWLMFFFAGHGRQYPVAAPGSTEE